MSNYLHTIDRALVSNSAAAVQIKEESDWGLREEVKGSVCIPWPTEPRGARWWIYRIDLWFVNMASQTFPDLYFLIFFAANDYMLQEHLIRRPFKAAKWRRFKVLYSHDGTQFLFTDIILNEQFNKDCLLFFFHMSHRVSHSVFSHQQPKQTRATARVNKWFFHSSAWWQEGGTGCRVKTRNPTWSLCPCVDAAITSTQ